MWFKIVFVSTLLGLMIFPSSSNGQGPEGLTSDNIDQLVLVDQFTVGDFVSIDFDVSGQKFVVYGINNGLTTFDRQHGSIIAHTQLSNPLKQVALASNGSFFVDIHESRGNVVEPYEGDVATIWAFDSLPVEGPYTQIPFGATVSEILLIEQDTLLLAGLDTGDIVLYQTADQSQVASWQAHAGGVTDVAYLGTTIISTGNDGRLKGWGLDGTLQFDLGLPNGLPVTLVHDSADNVYILYNDGRIVAANVTTQSVLYEIQTGMFPFDIAYGGNTIFAVDSSGKINNYDVATGNLTLERQFGLLETLPLQIMAFDPLTQALIVGGFDGQLHWLDGTGAVTQSIHPVSDFTRTFFDVEAFGPNMVVDTLHDLRVWNLDTNTWQIIAGRVGLMEFSDDGRWLAGVTANDSALIVFDAGAGFASEQYPLNPGGSSASVDVTHFVSATSYLVVGRGRGTSDVWDVSTGSIVAQLPPPSDPASITAMASSGNLLVAGYSSGDFRFWELGSFTEIDLPTFAGPYLYISAMEILDSPQSLLALHHNPQDREIFIDNGFTLWDLETNPGMGIPVLHGGDTGSGTFVLTPDHSAGIRSTDIGNIKGFVAFSLGGGYEFTGRADYDLGTMPTTLAFNEDASLVFIGLNNEILIFTTSPIPSPRRLPHVLQPSPPPTTHPDPTPPAWRREELRLFQVLNSSSFIRLRASV